LALALLHTSDLHIGKPFAGFDTEKAALLRESRLTAIARLAAAAREAGASIVLVAGDTFDQQGLADELVRRALARFAAESDIAWQIIPGNHDADRPGGIWERAVRLGLPANVALHRAAAPVRIADNCVLLPAPLKTRAVAADPTAWMDEVDTPDGVIRIGLAHGSTQGFGSEAAATVLIDAARRTRARLAYLALGDWHGSKAIADGVWYSGTPEPDQFAENEPGGALVVRIEQATRVEVRRVRVAERLWLRRRLTCNTAADLAALSAEVRALGPDAGKALLELGLEGRLTLSARREVAGVLDQLAAALFVLRPRVDGLTTTPDTADLDGLADRQLRRAAERLAAMAADHANPEARVAADALLALYALAESGTGAGP